MTRNEAMNEVRRMRLLEPGAYWVVTPRGGEWHVARVALPPGAKRPRSRFTPQDRPAARSRG
jgi:hypothetical protein